LEFATDSFKIPLLERSDGEVVNGHLNLQSLPAQKPAQNTPQPALSPL
jgi:hypothetical protein